MDLVFLSLQGLRISRYPGEDAFLGSHKVGDCTQHRFSSCQGFLLPPHPQVGTPVSRKRFARPSATSLIRRGNQNQLNFRHCPYREHLPHLFFLKACFIVAPAAVPVTNNLPIQGSKHFCQKVGMRSRCLRHVKAGCHVSTCL